MKLARAASELSHVRCELSAGRVRIRVPRS
jgi:hypothetical protein